MASFRPRPVSSRTTLMTWIFLSPTPSRTTSNSSFSSTAAASAAATPAAATGAADGGDVELLLERVDELGELEHGHVADGVEQLFVIRRHGTCFLLMLADARAGDWVDPASRPGTRPRPHSCPGCGLLPAFSRSCLSASRRPAISWSFARQRVAASCGDRRLQRRRPARPAAVPSAAASRAGRSAPASRTFRSSTPSLNAGRWSCSFAKSASAFAGVTASSYPKTSPVGPSRLPEMSGQLGLGERPLREAVLHHHVLGALLPQRAPELASSP